MKCKICEGETKIAFKAKILEKYEEELYECNNCRFLSVDKAFWLDEAYKEALNLSDTGIVSRNLYLYKIVCCIAYFIFGFRGGAARNRKN